MKISHRHLAHASDEKRKQALTAIQQSCIAALGQMRRRPESPENRR